jgi:hypothetical protein
MISSTLLLGAFFSLAGAVIFFLVGERLRRRRIATGDARLAWSLFVLWWYGASLSTLSGGVQCLLGAFGAMNLPLFLTLTQLNILSICVSLFGLLYYLIFLLVGSSRPLLPLIAFYLGYYALLGYYLNLLNPVGVSPGRWNVTIQYQHAPVGPLFAIVFALLVIPQMLGSLVYFFIFFRVRNVTQKYRILLVSCSIFLWFGSALLGSAAGLSAFDWWQVLTRVIGLAAALVILLAYQPFHWIRQRFGVTSFSDEAAE